MALVAMLAAALPGVSRTSAAAAQPAAAELYAVGVAKVDVTPDYPIRLNGFGNRRTESEGITQHIWAKALAIGEDGQKPLLLITVDSLGIRMSMADEVAARLAKKAGIERSRVAIAFSHSHTTPKVVGACDTIFSEPIPPEHQAHIDRYTAELTDALEKVALDALADRQPAHLQWAVGNVGFAVNRRTAGGPVDHSLPMMVVRSPQDDAIRAIYVTYACHCVTLSDNKISGDWAGYAQEAIERNHPGAVALVSIGCGSDSNPDSGVTGANTAAAAGQGAQIADEVERLLTTQLRPINGATTATLNSIDLPLNPPPSRDELAALAAKTEFGSYNARYQLEKLDRGEPLTTKIDYPVQTWAFGDSLAMVFLGGEICVDYVHRLRRELDGDRCWFHGYSNDFCSYIPSERLLKEGGYGGGSEVVYFALPNTLAPGLEQKIVDEVRRQVPEAFHPADADKTSRTTPPAEAALGAFKLDRNFVIELAAAEPLVRDPVAIDFGPDGRLWVVEMPDYSHEVEEKFQQHGTVKALVDHDGDGRFDEAAVFADGLRFPTDVKVWRDGVIVCDAPDVILLRDADGDGRADERKVLLTGFATHNAQARVNSLRWGLDNWVYGSCGIFGGTIASFNGQKFELGGQDFRFQPDTGEIEAATGRTQQGRDRDDWGNWFGCDNSTLAKHYPLTARYFARNPHVLPPPAEVFVPGGDDPTRLFPAAPPTLFKLSGPAGRPTSVCGLGVYRDDLLGDEFTGNVFVCEPVNGLVHREVLTPKGVTFTGHRAPSEKESEFLASTDPWFRPVQVRTGPDGCLWVVDMHRAVIEHKRFIPEETLRELDLMAGSDQGRIYRIRPRAKSPRPIAKLNNLDAAGLAAALDTPNGIQRDLAHQLLVQQAKAEAAPALTALASGSTHPATRLHALGALEGLRELTAQSVIAALDDKHPQVRRHTVRLAEPYLDPSPQVLGKILQLASDPDAHVRMQVAYSCGETDGQQVADALAQLACASSGDPYILSAVWSSVDPGNVQAVLQAVIQHRQDGPTDVVREAAQLAGKFAEPAAIRAGIEALSSPDGGVEPWQRDPLAALLDAIPADAKQALAVGDIADRLHRIAGRAWNSIESAELPEAELQSRLRLLVACSADRSDRKLVEQIAELLAPVYPPSLQQEAIRLLQSINSPAAAEVLLANWSGYSPATRAVAVEAALSRAESTLLLVTKLAAGEISSSQLDAAQRQRLLAHEDAAIRAAAAKALETDADSNRASVVAAFAPAATIAGNPARGRDVFGKHCASCHRLGDVGHVVGPNLAALSSRAPMALIESIFDPNRAVDERYQSYTALTVDGLAHTGILASETPTSIVLHGQEGKEHTLLRNELETFQNTGLSLMPEGLEKDLQLQDVADLLSYLATLAAPPKQIPGNRPQLVKATGGQAALLATNAEIYGDQITFEAPYQNIGYWHGQGDHVAWELQLDEPAEFDVVIEYACEAGSAGNSATIEGLASPIEFVVASTGTYDVYQKSKVGNTTLAAGRHRIVVRPTGSLARPNLMDLRGIYLVPPGSLDAGAPPVAEKATTPAEAIVALTRKFTPGTPAEYEHIPKIWEHSIASAKRNDANELREILAVSLPEVDQPLFDWQAVVIGGGLINGLTQVGAWPAETIEAIIGNDAAMLARWKYAIEQSVAMTDNEAVRSGTRYDALRMLGVGTFADHGEQLQRYVAKGVHPELQWGAVGALVDMDEPASADALIAAFDDLAESNQQAAIEGLLRSEGRAKLLRRAINDGRLPIERLSAEQQKRLDALAPN